METTKEDKSLHNHVALKIIGLITGILAAIVIVSVIFAKTVLPIYRYNSALALAEDGDYASAAMRLEGLTYKDSEEKYAEYRIKAEQGAASIEE